ncbi:MAG: formylglycine-generating enzyme family protein [Planctomycetota bacterium]|nr:formylglycine-generating enzyme family protein [Planctomycetota bacterium]
MRLKPISKGSFRMGSPKGESGRRSNEGPVHKVVITRPFWMGSTEVTQAQWKAIMGSNPSVFDKDRCGIDTSNYPVERVSWEDAVEFCKELTKRERSRLPQGYEYRLPTEAEWEYCCRAGTTTKYSFGDLESMLKDYGNYEYTPKWGGKSTAPVRSFKPNAWGLYDMHGNVIEWCHDRYGKDYYATCRNNCRDPQARRSGSGRVLRGGSWNSFSPSSAVRRFASTTRRAARASASASASSLPLFCGDIC